MTIHRKTSPRFRKRRSRNIGQKRKPFRLDYLTHPTAVVEFVRSVPHTEEMLAVAWLSKRKGMYRHHASLASP